MKINLKVRMRNKFFVVPMVTLIVTFVYDALYIAGIAPVIMQENVLQMLNLFADALFAIGILTDGTTPGMSDSDLVMSRGEEESEPNEL